MSDHPHRIDPDHGGYTQCDPANTTEEGEMKVLGRPVSEIVAIRMRVAESFLVTCQQVALAAREAATNARWWRRRAHQRWLDADADVGLAYADVLACRREITEHWPEPNSPASEAQLLRYAAVLMVNDPHLDEHTALEQARRDDTHYISYYGADPTVHNGASWPT